ncbi:MAG: glycosyltransferase family 4 protein [Hyphomicrobiales bacterium]
MQQPLGVEGSQTAPVSAKVAFDLTGLTVVYLVTEDWYFASHRLPIARAAKAAGARIVVATRCRAIEKRLSEEGFKVYPVEFKRASLNLLHDLRTVRRICKIYRLERPDIVHHVAIKPVLLGSIAAKICGVPFVINAMAGLGYIFTQSTLRARVLKAFVGAGFKLIARQKGMHFLVQNLDDRETLGALGVDEEKISIIRGSGVDTTMFQPNFRKRRKEVTCLYVGRLLWDKGIGELVEAARILKQTHPHITIRLVGSYDDNPASLSKHQLEQWIDEGLIDYRGHSDAVAGEFATADMAVLPSYREGLPKALLEAAACGLPLVATDVPGCREICVDGKNGLLVPPKNADAIAAAIACLAHDADIRSHMGKESRRLVTAHFSNIIIARQTLSLYSELLNQSHTCGRAQ